MRQDRELVLNRQLPVSRTVIDSRESILRNRIAVTRILVQPPAAFSTTSGLQRRNRKQESFRSSSSVVVVIGTLSAVASRGREPLREREGSRDGTNPCGSVHAPAGLLPAAQQVCPELPPAERNFRPGRRPPSITRSSFWLWTMRSPYTRNRGRPAESGTIKWTRRET